MNRRFFALRQRLQLAILLAISALVAVSCNEDMIVTTYDNGQVMEEYQYRGDSLKHGAYTRFSSGGSVIERSTYTDGKLDGIRTIYRLDGSVDVEETYRMGILDGPLTEYYENGSIKFEAVYTDNVLAGIAKGYYDSGELMEEVTFVDSREEGPFKEYHKNGKLKWEGQYRNGDNEYGLLQEYDSTGTLIRKMECDSNAICTTIWTYDGSHLKKQDQ